MRRIATASIGRRLTVWSVAMLLGYSTFRWYNLKYGKNRDFLRNATECDVRNRWQINTDSLIKERLSQSS